MGLTDLILLFACQRTTTVKNNPDVKRYCRTLTGMAITVMRL